MQAHRLTLGEYPTPVTRAAALDGARGTLTIKNDGLTSKRYGGNKVRKLEYLLAEAERRGARRVVTVGALGSHHVLATTVFARARGLRVAAVLCPQPWTAHAEETLATGLALGLEVKTAPSMTAVPLVVPTLLCPGDFFVPAGGSSALGALGYVDAMRELDEQIRAGELAEPDVIVAALGSGGTVAGLLVGAARYRPGVRVLGVDVAVSRPVSAAMVAALALGAARRRGSTGGARALLGRLSLTGDELGRGYGWRTSDGDAATLVAERVGLRLDPTYTAKTFAKCLKLVGSPGFAPAGGQPSRDRPLRVLYWHTLSATALAPLRGDAPATVPERLRRHFLAPRRG